VNTETELVFIVGPGSAGKSTTGSLLAERLGYGFIDLDLVFCERVGLIGDYVKEQGYSAYSETNSTLFEQLLEEYPTRMVFPLSSGFLVHEDSPELVRKHKSLLKRKGVSILLLPSRSLKETMDIIIPRQMARGYLDLVEGRERVRLNSRYPKYKKYGDIKIFSAEPPEQITDLITEELYKLGLPK
jgi:shikimate kinase